MATVQRCKNFLTLVKALEKDEATQIEACRGGLADLRSEVNLMLNGPEKTEAHQYFGRSYPGAQ